VQPSDTVVLHDVHVPLGTPHTGNPGVLHTLDRQHPAEHAVASHTHDFPTHSCCAPQAEPRPQVQIPDGHPSPVGAQPPQTAPPLPHIVEVVAVTQVPPAAAVVQHPEHDVVSQKHAPPMHTWSDAHGAPLVPHWQTPAVQVSVVAGHWRQPPPPTPHCEELAVTHVPPVQHPSGHVSSRQLGQTPEVHDPGRQLSHAAPPEPQLPSSSPVSHVAPLQHPAHEVVSQ
jgi:hypothetical protein